MELAFSKKKVEQRKTWLKEFVPGTYLDHDAEEISYTEFVHKELILFSRSDLLRSIPSMLDGLKPGQRKILFTCFQKNQKKDIKVRPHNFVSKLVEIVLHRSESLSVQDEELCSVSSTSKLEHGEEQVPCYSTVCSVLILVLFRNSYSLRQGVPGCFANAVQ